MTAGSQKPPSDAHGVRREQTGGRGVEKLNRWGRTTLEIVLRAFGMMRTALTEFFTKRRTYVGLAICFLYGPAALFVAAYALTVLVQRGEPTVTSELIGAVGLVAVTPIFGIAAELARETYRRGSGEQNGSGWLNRLIVGVEIAIIFLVFAYLTEAIVGSVSGGVGSFLPSEVGLPLVGVTGELLGTDEFVLSIDRLIAAYTLPAGFALYFSDERLSDLWPPGQFTTILVDRRYVSLFLAWFAINYVAVQFVLVSFGYVAGLRWLDSDVKFLLLLVVAGGFLSLAIFLSFFTIAVNANSVGSLAHEELDSEDSTVQSTIDRFRA